MDQAIHGPDSTCPACGAVMDVELGETWPEHRKHVHMGRPLSKSPIDRSTPVEKKEDDFLAAAVATYTVINL